MLLFRYMIIFANWAFDLLDFKSVGFCFSQNRFSKKPTPDTQTIPFVEMPAGNSYAPPFRDRVTVWPRTNDKRLCDWGRVRCEHTCSRKSTKDVTFILASGAVSTLVTNFSLQFPFQFVFSLFGPVKPLSWDREKHPGDEVVNWP